MSQDQPVTLRDLTEEFGLGDPLGSYPLEGVGSTLAAFSLRVLTALWIAGFIAIIAIGFGAGAYGRLAVVGAVLLALHAARAVPRWLAARRGGHRVLLYANGLVKTHWSGEPRDWVLWAEVAGVTSRRVRMAAIVLVFRTAEFRRADGGIFQVMALGLKPRLFQDLNQATAATPAADPA
jgi:hypothetical protein